MAKKKQIIKLGVCVKDFDGNDIVIKSYKESLQNFPSFARKVMGDDGTTALTNCVYKTNRCGCTIEGCGTLQFPLKVNYCPTHAAAPDMLEALKFVAKLTVEQIQKNPNSLKNHCKAAIAKATNSK